MTELVFSISVLLSCIAIGIFGALSGMGGGALLTPMLCLVFGVDIRYAMGAALIAAIASSSGAASAYVREGYTNLKVGMFLELATTFGAISGALLAIYVPKAALAIIFGLVLIQSAWITFKGHSLSNLESKKQDPLAKWLSLNGNYPTPEGKKFYYVQNVAGGFIVMIFAGIMSGLLGIGSGPMKVLAMDNVMSLPFKVSTTTSNFMIGVTAAASAGVYMSRGYIDPILSMPVMLGVVIGSVIGTRLLPKSNTEFLRKIFALVIILIAAEMIYKGATGNFNSR